MIWGLQWDSFKILQCFPLLIDTQSALKKKKKKKEKERKKERKKNDTDSCYKSTDSDTRDSEGSL